MVGIVRDVALGIDGLPEPGTSLTSLPDASDMQPLRSQTLLLRCSMSLMSEHENTSTGIQAVDMNTLSLNP